MYQNDQEENNENHKKTANRFKQTKSLLFSFKVKYSGLWCFCDFSMTP